MVSITVYRGIGSDGGNLGSFSAIASIDYTITSVSATAGMDFRGVNGQVVFGSGETEKTISLTILNDTSPEVEETFQISLSKPVGDVVLMLPTTTTIIISANDEPNGILTLLSPDSITPPLVKVDEDTEPGYALYIVLRTAGTFGTVTVRWEVFRNDSETGDVKSDISPAEGVLVFGVGQVQQAINISVIPDPTPEPTERFVVRLMPSSASGGAGVEGITYGILVIEDSDNYYGTVAFGPDSDQKIVIVRIPMSLL